MAYRCLASFEISAVGFLRLKCKAIQKYLEDPMAETIIKSSLVEGDKLIVDFDEEKSEITVAIKKGKKTLPKGKKELPEGNKELPEGKKDEDEKDES